MIFRTPVHDSWVEWLFYVTIDDIYVTTHTLNKITCWWSGGLKIKFDLRSGSHALQTDISFGSVQAPPLQGQLFRSGLPWRTPSLRKWDSTNNQKTKPRPSNPLLIDIIAHAGVNFSCHLWHAWGYGGPILLNPTGPHEDHCVIKGGGLLKGSIKGWLGPC